MIMRFNELLKEHGLEQTIELKGSFCMERCGEGINWQIDEEPLTSASVEDAVETFQQRVIGPAEGQEKNRGSNGEG